MTNQHDPQPDRVAVLRDLSNEITEQVQRGRQFDQPLVARSGGDGPHAVLIYAAGDSAHIDQLVEAARQVAVPHEPLG